MGDADGFWVNQEDVDAAGEASGSLKAKCAGNGLLYKLSKVKFCDVSGGTGQCLDVIRGGHGKNIVNATVSKPKKNDFSVNQKFRFLSFGFEDLSNQNEVEASCRIRMYIDDPQSRTIMDDEPAEEGYGGVDY